MGSSKFLAGQMVDGGYVALFAAPICAFLIRAAQTRALLRLKSVLPSSEVPPAQTKLGSGFWTK